MRQRNGLERRGFQGGERLEVLGIKFLWSRLEKEQSERIKKKREQYVKRKKKGKNEKGEKRIEGGPRFKYG